MDKKKLINLIISCIIAVLFLCVVITAIVKARKSEVSVYNTACGMPVEGVPDHTAGLLDCV